MLESKIGKHNSLRQLYYNQLGTIYIQDASLVLSMFRKPWGWRRRQQNLAHEVQISQIRLAGNFVDSTTQAALGVDPWESLHISG